MSPAEIAQRLGARPCGNGWITKCPAHQDTNPSLSIREGEGGRLLLHCFTGCSFQAIRNALGLPAPTGVRLRPQASARPQAVDAATRTTESARLIWSRSVPIRGTFGEKYLCARGITIELPGSLRFHPMLGHHDGIGAPAMVAAVQNREGDIVAILRTFLASDGRGKANLEPAKMALGPIAGGAVRFAKAAETLALAEGIETALSVQQATGIATWAALGTANFARIELPECVRQVIVCADHDVSGAGERAALAAAAKFMREGREVRIARPPSPDTDFNDLLRA
jgi:putative DNA primase/helicase